MLLSHRRLQSDSGQYKCTLVDTEFSADVTVTDSGSMLGRELAVIQEYSLRRLPIARNLAALYTYVFRHSEYTRTQGYNWALIERWRGNMDRWYPELQYGVKLYPCVVNQIKQLTWSKR